MVEVVGFRLAELRAFDILSTAGVARRREEVTILVSGVFSRWETVLEYCIAHGVLERVISRLGNYIECEV